jgi:hypothetical protein
MKARHILLLALAATLLAALLPGTALAADGVTVTVGLSAPPSPAGPPVLYAAGCPSGTTTAVYVWFSWPEPVVSITLYWRDPAGVWGGHALALGKSRADGTLGPFALTGTYHFNVTLKDSTGHLFSTPLMEFIVAPCDTTPPAVSGVTAAPADGLRTLGCNVGVTATVTAEVWDASGLAGQPALVFRQGGEGEWSSLPMERVVNNSFGAVLGGFAEAGPLSYYVEAADRFGNTTRSETLETEIRGCPSPVEITSVQQSAPSVAWDVCPGSHVQRITALVSDPEGIAREVRIVYGTNWRKTTGPGLVGVRSRWTSKVMTPRDGKFEFAFESLPPGPPPSYDVLYYVQVTDVYNRSVTSDTFSFPAVGCLGQVSAPVTDATSHAPNGLGGGPLL